MLTIKRITRGHVEFEHEGRTAVIEGEGLLRGQGSPDFVLYRNTLNRWAPPNDADEIDEMLKQALLEELLVAFNERGMTAEIE